MVDVAQHALGPSASAALPVLWRAMAAAGVSRTDLAQRLKISRAQLSRLLHGLRGPSLQTALAIGGIFPRVRPVLWTKPCPSSWQPHEYPDLRRRARREGQGSKVA